MTKPSLLLWSVYYLRWKQIFKEFFLAHHSDDRNDDLLFFVQRADEAIENGGLGVDPVFVKRKIKPTRKQLGHPHHEQHHLQEQEQRLLTPAQEAVVLWKDTFFLNVIVQVNPERGKTEIEPCEVARLCCELNHLFFVPS